MDAGDLYQFYRELQGYVGWEEDDARRISAAAAALRPAFPAIVDDFYAEIVRHPAAAKVITDGEQQIARLKKTLLIWLNDLFDGPYDEAFVVKRFRVGQRHVEIGLAAPYTQVALSRIRMRLQEQIGARYETSEPERIATVTALNRLLDLDMTMIEYAYQAEFTAREQRQERLMTLGKVAAGIAHELRNPLNAVKTSVYYLLNARNPTEEKTREHLQRIDRQVGISDGVITALSRFAKLPVPNVVPVDLCEFVKQTLDVNPVPENIELELDCPDDLPSVSGDADQLQIVLGNLIRNACDAMPDGGRLTLRGHFHSTSIDRMSNGKSASRFELSVTDTGCGIRPEDLQRIMEPLFSTKTRGLGLGLALARAIMERHDGELTVNSRPGHGTTFTMVLNVAQKAE
ncbi:MAG: protoglobin domain-containing protein [Planctomycetota bacterium]|jgi:signal transduction histidine kinase